MDPISDQSPSVSESLATYLDNVRLARSPNTVRTYSNALSAFAQALLDVDMDPDATKVSNASEKWIAIFSTALTFASWTVESGDTPCLSPFWSSPWVPWW